MAKKNSETEEVEKLTMTTEVGGKYNNVSLFCFNGFLFSLFEWPVLGLSPIPYTGCM